jgi:hypothetical protein
VYLPVPPSLRDEDNIGQAPGRILKQSASRGRMTR